MIRVFYGIFMTAVYTYWEYLMITLYDSLILQLLPIMILGVCLSCLWHIGFLAGLQEDANSGRDE